MQLRLIDGFLIVFHFFQVYGTEENMREAVDKQITLDSRVNYVHGIYYWTVKAMEHVDSDVDFYKSCQEKLCGKQNTRYLMKATAILALGCLIEMEC